MRKYEDAEAWFLGMRNLFRVHNYLENMMVRVDTFNLKVKADIWCALVSVFLAFL